MNISPPPSKNQPINNVLYAQAGGVTAVINASAAAVIESVFASPNQFGTMYGAFNGIKGILEERLIDLSKLSTEPLTAIKYQPGAIFKACRFDLDPLEHNPEQYARMLEIFKTYRIGTFFYNGGNGSMITAQKVGDYCRQHNHPVNCIGVAKTIDNDLAISHCSPGFGSAAKYLASSFLEATLDTLSMHDTSTRFFVMETMGRNTGWLTLAAGLIKDVMPDVPLILLPAERAFNQTAFLNKVQHLINQKGYCVCAVSEGLKNQHGDYLAIANIEHTTEQDYTQLGGVGYSIAKLVSETFNVKSHYAIPDYLQRSASHLVSKTDWQIAYDAGVAAVEAAKQGLHGVLPIMVLKSEQPFKWQFKAVPLQKVANLEKTVPDEFISSDGMNLTVEALNYLRPLIQGERPVPFKNGLPDIPVIEFQEVPKKLPKFQVTTQLTPKTRHFCVKN